MVFNNPNQQCYTQFFAGGLPPTGLRAGQNNLQNIRYICQMVNRQTYYGTMFDLGRGIAVFSAYTLTQANANFPNRQRPGQWTQTPGTYSLATYKTTTITSYRLYTEGIPTDRQRGISDCRSRGILPNLFGWAVLRPEP